MGLTGLDISKQYIAKLKTFVTNDMVPIYQRVIDETHCPGPEDFQSARTLTVKNFLSVADKRFLRATVAVISKQYIAKLKTFVTNDMVPIYQRVIDETFPMAQSSAHGALVSTARDQRIFRALVP
jgi:hypothetical protein